MVARVLLLLALLVFSGVAARGAVSEPPEPTVSIVPGPDVLAASDFAMLAGDDDRSLRVAVPAGSILRIDAAFALGNPTNVERSIGFRWEGATDDVRATAMVRGKPASGVVLAAGESAEVGLVVEALGPSGSRGVLGFVVVER